MGIRASLIAALLAATVVATGVAQTADQAALFKEAATREAAIRRELATARPGTTAGTSVQRRARTLVGALDDLARLFPTSGQADKALWQGASLSADLFFAFGDDADAEQALRLLASLSKAFPGSTYARQGAPLEHRLRSARTTTPAPRTPTPPVATGNTPGPATAAATPRAAATPPKADSPRSSLPRSATPAPRTAPASQPRAPREPGLVVLEGVQRELLADAVRVTITLDREVPYYSERIPGPDRVFVDLPRTRAVPRLASAVLPFADDVVRRVRVGTQTGAATRVVLDLEGSGRHSVYTMSDPFRIVIDVERDRTESTRPVATPATLQADRPDARPALLPVKAPAPAPALNPAPIVEAAARPAPAAPSRTASDAVPAVATLDTAIETAAAPEASKPDAPPPTVPAVNQRGGFSLSRQLGLGISRVVIDAGHGGHDPGAKGKGLTEADLTLDIALRLEKLLLKQPGVEVVQTRRTNTYVALEERTEMANRSGADLFLSIHANASTDQRARGVETYFLSFAQDAAAEAIAARENAASTRQMRQLPDLVKAIAFNNKVDESRDLARMVQQALYSQVRKSDRKARNLGVKRAPFLVLVGADMPSVLTEISFLTNQQDAGLLATEKYRQQIAEALLAGITRYQQSLKKATSVATKQATD